LKIGIALGGGGAKGFAHIGVLKSLTRAGIDCQVISGTSIGALVGAVYAAGNLEKLEETSKNIRLTDIPSLLSPAWSTQGLFNGNKALDYLCQFLNVENIEDLKKSFGAVSTDLITGTSVIFTRGSLRLALRASISIPGVFTPVVVDDKILIDGGTVEPIPIQLARSLGADYVIAVDLFGAYDRPGRKKGVSRQQISGGLGTALQYLRTVSEKVLGGSRVEREGNSKQRLLSIVNVVEQTLAVSQVHLTSYRLKEHPPDIIIKPRVSHIGLLDFHHSEDGILRGEEATEEVLEDLRRLVDLAYQAQLEFP